MTTQELKQYIDKVLGNNIRCLLPSYWWKRLFNQVADRIDDKQDILVSGKNIKTINGKELLGEGDTNVDIIINSVDELNALDLPTGSRASVVTGGPVLGSIKDCVESNDETQWTRVSGVQINAFPDFSLLSADVNEVAIYFYGGTSLPIYIIARKDESGSIMGAVRMSTSETIYLSLNGVDISQDAVDRLNGWLKTGDYKVAVYDGLHDISDVFDSFIKFYIYHPTISDVYVKADSWVRLAKEYVVSSEEELNALNVENGTIAKVAGGLIQINISDCYLSTDYEKDWDKYTIIKSVEEKNNALSEGGHIQLFASTSEMPYGKSLLVGWDSDGHGYGQYVNDTFVRMSKDEFNQELAQDDYRFVFGYKYKDIGSCFNFYTKSSSADAYIKGETWTRLLKEGDATGGSGDDKTLTFYAPTDGSSLSDTEKQHNAESYQKVAEGFESDTYYDIKVLLSTTQLVALDVIKTVNPAIDNGRLKLVFGGVGSGIDLQMLTVTSDGSATITIEGIEESGVELRDLYIYENYDGTFTELTEEQKAWNLETLELVKQGKAIVRTTLHGNTFILELFNEDNDYQFGYTQFSPSGGVGISVYVAEDGLSGVKIEESHFDSSLSTTSINAVQNKVVTAALNNKADKSDINTKQDKISDLETIRSGAAKGATALQEHQDISHLASKEELQNLQNEVIANEEVVASAFNDVNERINALTENVSGEAATKVELAESVATINETINANDKRYDSEFSALDDRIDELAANVSGETVTKVEFEETITNLTNEILDNEEVVASAFNDVNVRINELAENVSGEAATKVELNDAVDTINQTIQTNDSRYAQEFSSLDTQIKQLAANVQGEAVTKTEFQETLSDLNNEILDNEEVVASAINDLNARIAALEDIIATLQNS